MQTILVNIFSLGLMVWAFGIVSRTGKDDRFRCWTLGWGLVLIHLATKLVHPATPLGQHLQTFAAFATLALAGIAFLVSTIILSQGARRALRLFLAIACLTLPLLAAVSFEYSFVTVLAAAFMARQLVAALASFRLGRSRPQAAAAFLVLIIASTSWGLYGLSQGQPTTLTWALLTEIFGGATIAFLFARWKPTYGLFGMAAGLATWAASFPVSYSVRHSLPRLALNGSLWNLPVYCLAAGMILLALEEDTRKAQRHTEDYRVLFDDNPSPLWILEPHTLRFVAANQAAVDLHGYTREELLQLTAHDLLDVSSASKSLSDAASDSPLAASSLLHVRKNGQVFPMDVSSRSVVFEGKRCHLVVGIDASERDALQQQLLRQTRHDSLTGLVDRYLFEEQLAEAVRKTTRAGEKLAILCLDISRFKHINDLYGPRVGDACLQHVARMLTADLRAGELVARTGGDEFAVVLTGLRNAAAILEQTAADVRRKFQQPIMVQGFPIQITFCMGMAICPDDGIEAVALWRGAESALRRAQMEGGGRAVWLSPELREEAEQQIEIEATMRRRMGGPGFHLHYQPVYGFEGRVRSLEALIRMEHAAYGQVSPSKMIPIAEETGLIFPLGLWVIEEVCRQLRTWIDQQTPVVPIAINVSAIQLKHADFAERVMEALTKFRIAPELIHLEVTETAAMRNLKNVAGQMAILAEAGISFSIDDFGTGHSSLGRLHQLPISVLKIDRSFIEQLCGPYDSYTSLTIVQAIVSMAHALGQKVVAEGVETPAQLACLRGLECDLLQGFLLSRPLPPEQIPTLLSAVHAAFSDLPMIQCYPSAKTHHSSMNVPQH